MKTVLEFDNTKRLFIDKKSTLALYEKRTMKCLGETEFNLSKYANEGKATEDKLKLNGELGGHIEIFIRAKNLDPNPQTPSFKLQHHMMMPTIQERESETDFREDFERKEKEFKRTIDMLEEQLDELKKQEEDQIERLNNSIKEEGLTS